MNTLIKTLGVIITLSLISPAIVLCYVGILGGHVTDGMGGGAFLLFMFGIITGAITGVLIGEDW